MIPSPVSAAALQHRLPHDLLDRRHAVLDLLEARAAKGDHALLEALSLDLDGRRAREDELADLLRDLEHLDEGDAALVTGVVALLAAPALHDLAALGVLRREAERHEDLRSDFRGGLAARAHAPDQALRRDEDDRRRDAVGLDAHGS